MLIFGGRFTHVSQMNHQMIYFTQLFLLTIVSKLLEKNVEGRNEQRKQLFSYKTLNKQH